MELTSKTQYEPLAKIFNNVYIDAAPPLPKKKKKITCYTICKELVGTCVSRNKAQSAATDSTNINKAHDFLEEY